MEGFSQRGVLRDRSAFRIPVACSRLESLCFIVYYLSLTTEPNDQANSRHALEMFFRVRQTFNEN